MSSKSKASKVTNSTQHITFPHQRHLPAVLSNAPPLSVQTYVSARKFVLHIVTHVKDKGPNLKIQRWKTGTGLVLYKGHA